MQLPSLLSIVTLISAASAVTVSYDTGYDDKARSLTSVTCSDGQNGLMTRYGWKTQGEIPRFPYIAGVQGIGWNSPKCGACYHLKYKGKSIYVLAVDSTSSGYNLGLTAMNALTGGQAVALGRIDASATKVPVKNCGL